MKAVQTSGVQKYNILCIVTHVSHDSLSPWSFLLDLLLRASHILECRAGHLDIWVEGDVLDSLGNSLVEIKMMTEDFQSWSSHQEQVG